MIKVTLFTDDGETGLVVEGPDLAWCINEVWQRLLRSDPDGPAPEYPPLDEDGFRSWCYTELDGATASISVLQNGSGGVTPS